MPRLVHLARERDARAIARSGIRGARRAILGPKGEALELRHAVYAMPVLPDFSATHQWLRELRRWDRGRMVAVHFVAPSDELVHVGRFNRPHAQLPLGEAIARVKKNAPGSELVFARSIPAKAIAAVREVTQLVGWTETPEGTSFDCLCQACVPPGKPELVRRIRAAIARSLHAARTAESPQAIASALGAMDIPLERARQRIAPDKLLPFARAESPEVRRCALALLGHFRFADVEPILAAALDDPSAGVREAAVGALVRAGGLRRAYACVARASEEWARIFFVSYLETAVDDELATELLTALAVGASPRLKRELEGAKRRLDAERAG